MFRALQLIFHLPLLKIVIPANVMIVIENLLSIIAFDLSDYFNPQDYMTFLQYDDLTNIPSFAT